MALTWMRARFFVAIVAITACVCILPGHVHARELANYGIRIVAADDSTSTQRIIHELQKKYPTATVISDTSQPVARQKAPLYIAVGPSSLRALLSQETDGPVISIFTASQAYHTITDSAKSKTRQVTAIYADPSPLLQMRLITAIYKRKVTVAVLLSEKTAYQLPLLQQAAALTNLEFIHQNVLSDEFLNRALNRTADAHVLLAMPDSGIYNNENIRNILLTTYRHNKAVIGFSAGLVRAGALATISSSIEDILAQTYEAIEEIDQGGRLIDPQYPKYFSVIFNDDVARSLNLHIDDTARKFSRKPGVGKP